MGWATTNQQGLPDKDRRKGVPGKDQGMSDISALEASVLLPSLSQVPVSWKAPSVSHDTGPSHICRIQEQPIPRLAITCDLRGLTQRNKLENQILSWGNLTTHTGGDLMIYGDNCSGKVLEGSDAGASRVGQRQFSYLHGEEAWGRGCRHLFLK